MRLVKVGEPNDGILREKCERIKNLEGHMRSLLLEMKSFVEDKENKAAGLAAPQAGSNIHAFVMWMGPNVEIIINPIIAKRNGPAKAIYTEGCLSVGPEIKGKVKRYQDIEVIYNNLNMKPVKKRLKGFEAVCFQHEYDHLNGIMFTDKVEKEEQNEA